MDTSPYFKCPKCKTEHVLQKTIDVDNGFLKFTCCGNDWIVKDGKLANPPKETIEERKIKRTYKK